MRILLAPVLVAGLGLLLATGESRAQVQPCTDGCIEVSVTSPPPPPIANGGSFTTTVNYQQGSADKGLDNEAAIAFSLSIPSLKISSCEAPDSTTLICDTPAASDGLSKAFTPSASVADFRVVIENTCCKDDGKPCLCPKEGQTRAQYINVVVFGPKVLPTPGAGVTFPILQTGPLLDINLTVDNPTTTPLTLHVYNETDDQATKPKPQFGALASVGDTAAVDDTVNRTDSISNVIFNDGTVDVVPGAVCLGDCNHDCEVSIGELQIGLNILFGSQPVSTCPAFDPDNTGGVGIGQLQIALNNLFGGCPQPCTPQ